MVRGLHPIVPDFPFVLPEAMVKEFRLSSVAVILSARSSLEIGCCSSALSRFATVGLEIAAVGSFAFDDSAVVDFAATADSDPLRFFPFSAAVEVEVWAWGLESASAS